MVIVKSVLWLVTALLAGAGMIIALFDLSFSDEESSKFASKWYKILVPIIVLSFTAFVIVDKVVLK